MSTYHAPAYNPKEKVIRKALWIDDYFGLHEDAVKFKGDAWYYRLFEVMIPLDKVFVLKDD